MGRYERDKAEQERKDELLKKFGVDPEESRRKSDEARWARNAEIQARADERMRKQHGH